MDKLLKVKDIKESLGCGINRAYEIVNQKDFPKIIIGKRIYIPEKEYELWLKKYLYKEYIIWYIMKSVVDAILFIFYYTSIFSYYTFYYSLLKIVNYY